MIDDKAFSSKKRKRKKKIDDIAIGIYSSKNFVNMKDIWRKCNLMVGLSKFMLNKKILSGALALDYNIVCCQSLSYYLLFNL